MLAADGDRCNNVVDGAWHDDADRDLPIVRGVGRIKGPALVVEPHLGCRARPDRGGNAFGAITAHEIGPRPRL